jgi:hypothetical protein
MKISGGDGKECGGWREGTDEQRERESLREEKRGRGGKQEKGRLSFN